MKNNRIEAKYDNIEWDRLKKIRNKVKAGKVKSSKLTSALFTAKLKQTQDEWMQQIAQDVKKLEKTMYEDS